MPMRAQLLMGSLGFSTNLLMVPSLLKMTTPYLLRAFDLCGSYDAVAMGFVEGLDEGFGALFEEVVSEVHDEGSPLR